MSSKIGLKIKLAVLAVLTIMAGFVWQQVWSQQASQQYLKVDFFDVGQGDSIFIETPDKKQILIDGGPGEAVLEKLGKEMGFFDRSLDLVILTHPDSDHLNGLIEVLRHYQVAQILESPAQTKGAGFKEWQNLIAEKHIPVTIGQAGQQVKISPQINFDVVYPFSGSGSGTNVLSVVGRLCYQQICFFMAGDIEESQEKTLGQTNFNLNSQVLKVAHHGSKTSSSDILLERVQPQIAVISVGKDNSFGHPAPEIVERLKKYTDRIFRTDEKGDVVLKTDGIRLLFDNQ